MIKDGMKRVAILLLLASPVPGLAWADGRPQKPQGEPGRPPQVAIDACNGQSEGASVEISTPRGTIKGTCRSFSGQLVAVPEGAPPPPPNNTSSTETRQ
jgi:hypothetical protein